MTKSEKYDRLKDRINKIAKELEDSSESYDEWMQARGYAFYRVLATLDFLEDNYPDLSA